jgi:hypothetical protein
VGADTTAKCVGFRCPDDYYEADMPTALHPQTSLTFEYDGERLPAEYGYPLKLRMPAKLGYKNPKHMVEMFVTNTYPGGYWVDQGYNWFGGSWSPHRILLFNPTKEMHHEATDDRSVCNHDGARRFVRVRAGERRDVQRRHVSRCHEQEQHVSRLDEQGRDVARLDEEERQDEEEQRDGHGPSCFGRDVAVKTKGCAPGLAYPR